MQEIVVGSRNEREGSIWPKRVAPGGVDVALDRVKNVVDVGGDVIFPLQMKHADEAAWPSCFRDQLKHKVRQGGINPRDAPSEFEVSQGGVTPPGARREADVAPDFEKKVTVLFVPDFEKKVTVLWSLEKNVKRKRTSNGLVLERKRTSKRNWPCRSLEKNVERNWPCR